MESDSKRPPHQLLVKTSWGRVHVLPSRLRDSVIDPCKKEKPNSKALNPVFDSENADGDFGEKKVSGKKPKFETQSGGNQFNEEKFSCKSNGLCLGETRDDLSIHGLFRQGQTQLYKSKPKDFRMAIEEAFLEEYEFGVTQPEEDKSNVLQTAFHQSVPRGIQEATDSNQYEECQSQNQVRCDGCKFWVHAECDKISNKVFKNMENIDYFCPNCKERFNFELSDTEKRQPQLN